MGAEEATIPRIACAYLLLCARRNLASRRAGFMSKDKIIGRGTNTTVLGAQIRANDGGEKRIFTITATVYTPHLHFELRTLPVPSPRLRRARHRTHSHIRSLLYNRKQIEHTQRLRYPDHVTKAICSTTFHPAGVVHRRPCNRWQEKPKTHEPHIPLLPPTIAYFDSTRSKSYFFGGPASSFAEPEMKIGGQRQRSWTSIRGSLIMQLNVRKNQGLPIFNKALTL